MYQSSTALEAPLAPRMFFAEDALALEQRCIFETTWQMVGLASSISKPGQYLAIDVGSVPVVVRNFDGELVALRNVCAHRHCTLVSARQGQGQSDKLKCPYHGWEYGADGRTRKIPAAKNFPDFDREHFKLTSFSLGRCGDLLFVRIAREGPPLQDWLGDLYEKFEEWTSVPHWKPAVIRSFRVPANWKIPVEGSLESYHIPEVHRQTFGEDPGESKSEHAFAKYTTSFFTSFNTPRLVDKFLKVYEQLIMWLLGAPFTAKYEHHHIFPNLLISHTDSLTLVQTVKPLTGESSVSDIWQYGRQSVRRNPVSKLSAALWGRFTGWLSYQILKEDIRIFPQVQRGERAATDRSLLGRCEERLFAFETFLRDQVQTQQACNSESETGVANDLCKPMSSCSDATRSAEVRQ